MTKTLLFIGHNFILKYPITQTQLIYLLEEEYLKGYKHFIISSINDFDNLIYDIARIVQKIYPNLKITIILNDTKTLQEKTHYPIKNANIIYSFYPLTKKHFTYKIYEQVINLACYADKFYCFLDTKNALTIKLLEYAKLQEKEIFNLFELFKNDV